MTNHLHVLLRIDARIAEGWTDEDVVWRWGRLFPASRRVPAGPAYFRRLGSRSAEGRRVGGEGRERLQSISWLILLVDYTGRLFRAGKAAISAELAGIFERLGTTGESRRVRLEKLRQGRLFGRFFAASRERLKRRDRTPGSAVRVEPGRRPAR